jgi:cation-transporting ATPase F
MKAMNEKSPQRVAWHFIAADEAATRLQASYDEGLAGAEVLSRRALHGENRITPKLGKGPLLRFALQFVQPLVLVLAAGRRGHRLPRRMGRFRP